MFEEAKTNRSCGRAQAFSRLNVLRSRCWVAGRVVMGDGERPTIMAKHGVEDLANWQEGTVDAALAYRNDQPEVIRGIADEHDCSLAGGVSNLPYRDGRDVSGASQPRWQGLVRSESG
jgi:hypothetical protein